MNNKLQLLIINGKFEKNDIFIQFGDIKIDHFQFTGDKIKLVIPSPWSATKFFEPDHKTTVPIIISCRKTSNIMYIGWFKYLPVTTTVV